jgi:uncharacterized membrane protein
MKKFLFLLTVLFFLPFKVSATSQDYIIESFNSQIKLNQNASLEISETIKANFYASKHGIFRIIPAIYSYRGKTINSRLKVLSVVDESGKSYPYSTSKYNQSVKIKIGDPDKTITGKHTYIIRYLVSRVVAQFEDSDEIYWNVTGHEWDTEILKTSVVVESPFAKISKIDCFAGQFNTQQKNCQGQISSSSTANFEATIPISYNKDFSVIIGLDKNNQLSFPGTVEKTRNILLDNWGYPIALFPFFLFFFLWYKKGRDSRYLSDNFYIKEKSKKTKIVSLWERPHLPTVYSPINGLTPAEVGTIIDQKVDTHDIVAEIVELARLGFIKIKKIKVKKLISSINDYQFEKLEKNDTNLKEHQKYLFEKIFAGAEKNSVKLSDLKNKFYKHLSTLRKKIYDQLIKDGVFEGNPEKIRAKYLAIFTLVFIICISTVSIFANQTDNFAPLILCITTIIPTIILVFSMPKRKAWGYSLSQQINGLKWYLGKSKWRQEISEKHLFLEGILPLAIALRLVSKLAKDMEGLEIEPPSYLGGMTTHHLYRDINTLNTKTASALISAPGNYSGKSSWSGGSGFSGGSSGGGFGGGGGGSW